MKLTVIGCWGAYPGPGGATSGYLIENGEDNLLLDCGSSVLSKLYEYTDLNRINNIVLSHYHADHVTDIGCMQYAAKVEMSLGERTESISIYGHTHSDYFKSLSFEDATIGKPFEEGTPLILSPFTLHFRRTPHPVPAFAVRIESGGISLGYTGDTGWNNDLIEFFKGVDLLLCESSLYNKFQGRVEGHLSAGEAGRLAREAGAGELILTH
ncbi:MAG: MBL fold metallo-hydrolase, partial [Spirochaetales bacterium]|nr:MBL fold metallo-hydrolase [Spirochaetales bacterium]